MSWEELELRPTRVPLTAWRISVMKSGIVIWIPTSHALASVDKVATMIGRDKDVGKIRLVASTSTNARLVNKVKSSTGKVAPHLKYSTLPEAPKTLKVTEVAVTETPDGAVEMLLPWFVRDFSGVAVAHGPIAQTLAPRDPPPKPDPRPSKDDKVSKKEFSMLGGKVPATTPPKPLSPAEREAAAWAMGDRATRS